MNRILDLPVIRWFSSLWLSCTLLTLLGILTWLGTLEQVDSGLYEVQRKYFESIWLVHWQTIELGTLRGSLPIPLPGATLVMIVLFVNLVLGGVLRMRRGLATIGILTTHFGILFLLIAGFIKAKASHDGYVRLGQGERSNAFESYNDWELAVFERLDGGQIREAVAPQADFMAATSKRVPLKSADFPFDLEVAHFLPNSRVLPKGPMFEAPLPVVGGFFLDGLPPEKENSGNVAGAYVTVVEKQGGARHDGIVWGATTAPWVVAIGGKSYGIELRRERYLMPFALELELFKKEDHPRMEMAKSFSSDVTVIEGGSQRAVKISMNEPLRQGGLVVYQSSWGPQNAPPGTPLYSVFSVVQNPADQYPLYACIVIAIGLVLHFSRKLFRHVRSEAQKS